MEAYLGEYVITRRGQRGRVYAKHDSFDQTRENKRWLACQDPPVEDHDLDKSWYDILGHDGGAISVPESRIIKKEDPYLLNNIWEDHYFNKNLIVTEE